ncbi:Mitochondrial distribution and morphology protein 10 [Geranomyces michiganensis]|nr:Mitochondrial distribution and morphology protein 10 [Geranomyces michiganensis]
MIEYMDYALRSYYLATGWREDRQYSSLLARSRRILDFSVPTGFSVTVGKSVSPELKSSYTLGVPNIRAAGFLFTALPIDLPPLRVRAEDELRLAESHVDVFETGEASSGNGDDGMADSEPVVSRKRPPKGYLVYGRLYEDLHLEAMGVKSLGANTHMLAYGINSWERRSLRAFSSVSARLRHASRQCTTELSYASEDQVFGLSTLYRFAGSHWATGSEVYYTAKERSGGLSLGARYERPSAGPDEPETVLSFLANPMMGHVSASYTTTVRRGLSVATRYRFNVYSYEADMAVGLEYAPVGSEQVIKTRLSLTEGLALRLEGQYRRSLISIGLMTNFTHNPRRSIGIELQIA